MWAMQNVFLCRLLNTLCDFMSHKHRNPYIYIYIDLIYIALRVVKVWFVLQAVIQIPHKVCVRRTTTFYCIRCWQNIYLLNGAPQAAATHHHTRTMTKLMVKLWLSSIDARQGTNRCQQSAPPTSSQRCLHMPFDREKGKMRSMLSKSCKNFRNKTRSAYNEQKRSYYKIARHWPAMNPAWK